MNDFWESFRQTLRQERIAVGLTHQAMADRLHISRSTYTYYETGKTRPNLETLVLIAQILDRPVTLFLSPEGQRGQ